MKTQNHELFLLARKLVAPDYLLESMSESDLELFRDKSAAIAERIAFYLEQERSDPRYAAAWALTGLDTARRDQWSKDPSYEHFAAARAALAKDEIADPPDATVDTLARALNSELPKLSASLFWGADPNRLPVRKSDDDELPGMQFADAEHGGMLLWDALFVDYLRSMGPEASTIADGVAIGAGRRFADYQQRKAALSKPDDLRADLLWAFWTQPRGELERGALGPYLYLVPLALALWVTRIKGEIDLANHPRARFHSISTGDGDEYVKIERAVSSLSWAMGGDGVELDGDQYAYESKLLTRQVPRSWAVLPRDAKQYPHQLNLPLADGETVALMVAVTDTAGPVIPPVAGKVLLVLMAGASKTGLVACTLGELASKVYPDAKRIQSRELTRLDEGLRVLGDLRLVLPDDTYLPLFVIQLPVDPNNISPDQGVGWELPRLFKVRVQQHRRQLNGWFLINLTGAMRLDTRQPQLLRQYVRAASVWNDAHEPATNAFNPARVQPYTLEQWAMLNNTLSRAAVDYLASNRKVRPKQSALSTDLKTTMRALDELVGVGLVQLQTRNRRRELLILPPEPYLEAYQQVNQRPQRLAQKPAQHKRRRRSRPKGGDK